VPTLIRLRLQPSLTASAAAEPSPSPYPSPLQIGGATSLAFVRLSPALVLHWDPQPLYLGTATVLNLTLEVALSAIGGEGWIGLGFGDSMITAQLSMTMLPAGQPASVRDLYAFDGYTAAPSAAVDKSRFTIVSDTIVTENNTRWITWTRPLATFSGGIQSFTSGPTSLVHSWHTGLAVAYHGVDKRGACAGRGLRDRSCTHMPLYSHFTPAVTGRLNFAPAPGASASSYSFSVISSEEALKRHLRAVYA